MPGGGSVGSYVKPHATGPRDTPLATATLTLSCSRFRGLSAPWTSLPSRTAEQAECVFVDAPAGAEGHQFNQPSRSDSVDDPMLADPEATEARKVIPQLLSGRRVGPDHIEGGANLALELRMETADEPGQSSGISSSRV